MQHKFSQAPRSPSRAGEEACAVPGETQFQVSAWAAANPRQPRQAHSRAR